MERRPTRTELRLRRLGGDEAEPAPRGILELFDDEPDDADAALTRDDEHDDG
ncbi:MAG TPA: hypothetical protein VE995_05775 [Gaiellaceae bacterium]|nr:hypothetical protein [Gaiellaceae bacterium]